MSKTEEFIDWLKIKEKEIPEITNKIFNTGEDLTEEDETILRTLVVQYCETVGLNSNEQEELKEFLQSRSRC